MTGGGGPGCSQAFSTLPSIVPLGRESLRTDTVAHNATLKAGGVWVECFFWGPSEAEAISAT